MKWGPAVGLVAGRHYEKSGESAFGLFRANGTLGSFRNSFDVRLIAYAVGSYKVTWRFAYT
jgi:hypothetical protein